MASASKSQISSIEDVTCPICLLLLIKPVTLPCGHELCLSCFNLNVQDGESALVCPMCRLRISSWTRRVRKHGGLVNQKRWQMIQEKFPHKVKSRLDGAEDSEDGEYFNF